MKAVFATVQCNGINAAHREAAVDAAISLLQQVNAASRTKELCHDADVLLAGFDCIYAFSSDVKGKVVKQLLSSLLSAIQQLPEDSNLRMKRQILDRVMVCLHDESDPGSVKPALQILSAALQKGSVTSKEAILRSRPSIVDDSRPETIEVAARRLIRVLFLWILHQHVEYAAAHAAIVFIKAYRAEFLSHPAKTGIDQVPVWQQPLLDCIKSSGDGLNVFRSQVFPELFASDPFEFFAFVQHLGVDKILVSSAASETQSDSSASETNQLLLLTALQVGKEQGLVCEYRKSSYCLRSSVTHCSVSPSAFADCKQVTFAHKQVMLPDRVFDRLLSDRNPHVRLAALSLVVSSHSASRPLTLESLRSLQRHMFDLFTENDAYIRGEMLAVLKRLLRRFRMIVFSLRKAMNHSGGVEKVSASAIISVPTKASSNSHLIRRHERFIDWLFSFLLANLRPGAPYQQHFMSLSAYFVLVQSGLDSSVESSRLAKQAARDIPWAFHRDLFPPAARRLLTDLLMDPFDDIRSLAAFILDICPQPRRNVLNEELLSLLKRGEEVMLSSGRADHADGVSHTHCLIFSSSQQYNGMQEGQTRNSNGDTDFHILERLLELLESTIDTAESDPALAIERFSMHGTLTSIR